MPMNVNKDVNHSTEIQITSLRSCGSFDSSQNATVHDQLPENNGEWRSKGILRNSMVFRDNICGFEYLGSKH